MLIKQTGTYPTLRKPILKVKTTRNTTNIVNDIVGKHLHAMNTNTLEELHEVIYRAAAIVTTLHTNRMARLDTNTHTTKNKIDKQNKYHGKNV